MDSVPFDYLLVLRKVRKFMPIDMTGDMYRKAVSAKQNTDADASKEKVFTLSLPKYKLNDLILTDSTKEAILDAVSVYQNSDKIMNEWGLYEKYHDRMNLSINLYGESGTGKTMAAHAIADALNKQILFVDYAEIESKYVGETSKNLKQLFVEAKEQDAVIIFDEADALLSKRVTDMRSSTDVSVNQTRSVLLNILNEYAGIVIFTTNFIQNFDPAFIRRIRYQIRFDLPDEELRTRLWKLYIPEKLPVDFDVSLLGRSFDNISGSDISNAVFSTAVSAARRGKEVIGFDEFKTAIEMIIQAKRENKYAESEVVTRRKVSKEYVENQLGRKVE